MLIPVINGHEPSEAVLDAVRGQPQLVGLGRPRPQVLGGLGASYTPADVTALQNALVKAGKSVRTDGVMDGNTLASVYEVIRDKSGPVGGAIAALVSQSASSSVQNAFKALQDLDAKLGKVPGISLSIPSLLRDASKVATVVSVAQAACKIPGAPSSICDVANKTQNALNSFFSTMSAAAGTLVKVVYVLVPGSAPSTSTLPGKLQTIRPDMIATMLQPTTSTTPGATTYPAGTIYAQSSKQPGVYRIAVPRTSAGFGYAPDVSLVGAIPTLVGADAAYTEVAPSSSAPSNGTPVAETDLEAKIGTLPLYKNWKFWAAVGGGVVVVGGLIALLSSNHKHEQIAQRSRAFERGDMRALGFDLDDDEEELGGDNYDDVIDVGEDQ